MRRGFYSFCGSARSRVSAASITCKVRLKHTYTHVSHKSMCNTILVPRAARVGDPRPPYTHTPLPPSSSSHTLCARVCPGSNVLLRVRLAGLKSTPDTAEHQSGAMWCLPYTRTRSTFAQNPRYAFPLAFWCLRHVLDCVLRGSDRVLSHVQSPGISSLCTGTQKKAIFRHVLKIATRGLSQGLFKESHTS